MEVKINLDVFKNSRTRKLGEVANFEYQGIQYELKGVMEKDKFDKILKNLYFL